MTWASTCPPVALLPPISRCFLVISPQLLGLGGCTRTAAAAVASKASAAGPCVVASGAPGPFSAAPPAAVLAASALASPLCPPLRSYQFFRCLLVMVGQSEA